MSAPARPAPSRFALGVIAAALALAVLVVGLSSLRGASAGAGEAAGGADPVPVETLEVRYQEGAQMQVRYPGLVTARRESALGFETGGRIASIAVDIGDRVEAGDALAALDTRSLEAQLAAARADAEAARAQAELAEATLARQRTLLERGHVSRQRLDEAASTQRAARAQADAATAAADALAVQIDLARIEAPFSGVITARHFDEGAVAGPGAPVLTLVEAGALELRVGLPARETRALVTGDLYEAELDGTRARLRLRSVTGVVDRESRSVTAVFDFIEPGAARAGEVARLILPAPLEDRGFWAPVTALAEGRRGLWSVYVLTGQGPFGLEPRPVEILHSEGERVYLSGAVEEGSLILATGLQRVTPGQSVMPARQEG